LRLDKISVETHIGAPLPDVIKDFSAIHELKHVIHGHFDPPE
jgi:hypothetical protein